MSATVIPLVYGAAPADEPGPTQAGRLLPLESPRRPAAARETLWSVVPPLLLALAVLILGLYLPQEVNDLLHRAARVVGAE
jgi:hypothetical protein